LHQRQREIASSSARFKVIRAGRRSGKSSVEIEVLIFHAVGAKGRNVGYIAPTQKQARSIIWEALKARLGSLGTANESRLEMKVPTADGGTSTIFVGGWENRESYRGMKFHHLTFDELDTMKDFFIGWQEIFRPSLVDTQGTADFIGTPKKENPNLRRLEKEYQDDPTWGFFQFPTSDNPHIPPDEIRQAKESMDADTFRQEFLAEYIDNAGALFRYASLVDMFTNTVDKTGQKYLIVDIADDGSDKTVFNFFDGLESYRIEQFSRLNTEGIVTQIREYAAMDRIPYSNIAVDAIGVGAGVSSPSMLDGIVGFKSSLGAIRTDHDPVRLPNVHYTGTVPLTSEYRNLRSQCVFTLAGLVNEHKVACRAEDVRLKERIIEELALYQDVSQGERRSWAMTRAMERVVIRAVV